MNFKLPLKNPKRRSQAIFLSYRIPCDCKKKSGALPLDPEPLSWYDVHLPTLWPDTTGDVGNCGSILSMYHQRGKKPKFLNHQIPLLLHNDFIYYKMHWKWKLWLHGTISASLSYFLEEISIENSRFHDSLFIHSLFWWSFLCSHPLCRHLFLYRLLPCLCSCYKYSVPHPQHSSRCLFWRWRDSSAVWEDLFFQRIWVPFPPSDQVVHNHP